MRIWSFLTLAFNRWEAKQVPVRTIQYMLGHKSLETRMRYLGIPNLDSLRDRSAEEKTSGSVVRVDEDRRDVKESEVARDRQGWVAIHVYRGCLQPLPIEKPDGGSRTSGTASGQLSV
jgi:hypothetical protein